MFYCCLVLVCCGFGSLIREIPHDGERKPTFRSEMLEAKLIFLLLLDWSLGKPNVVFVLTDDQDVALGGMTPLKKTKNLLVDEGVSFVNAYATTPICCPSRSSILTGLYVHNHRTVNNSRSGGCSDIKWQRTHESRTFGAVLHASGYRTFYAGKYLNQYGFKKSGGVEHVPPGWDWWVGLVGNSVYYNYTLSVNGTGVLRGDKESDYLTDVLKEYSLEFLKQKQEEPFLMVVAPPSPHEPFTPANRHKGKFSGFKAPRTPNFNIPVNKTKHWLLRLPPDVLPSGTVHKIDDAFRNRWESLLSVDELVEAIILRLDQLRVLNNTYVMLSSDHGFHLGQFAQVWDKRQPYETDIRIPLVVRGPEIYKKVSDYPVLNVDFAASILDMAGITRKFGDGMSFLPGANSVPDAEPSRDFLIEYHGESEGKPNECYDDPNVKLCDWEKSCKCFDAVNNSYVCFRSISEADDKIYCKFHDDESYAELYNIRNDPYQLNNMALGLPAEANDRILKCCQKMFRLEKQFRKCFDLFLPVGS